MGQLACNNLPLQAAQADSLESSITPAAVRNCLALISLATLLWFTGRRIHVVTHFRGRRRGEVVGGGRGGQNKRNKNTVK